MSESSNLDAQIAKYLPFLREIQKKLFFTLSIMVAVGVVAGYHYQTLLKWVMSVFELEGITIVMTSPYQFINLAVNTGFVAGVSVGLPLLGYFIIQFVKPALRLREYRLLSHLYPLSILLFVIGFLFGSWIIQFVVQIYAKTTLELAVTNYWDIGSFFSQIITTGLSLGIVFEMPIVMLALLQLKVLTHAQIACERRYIYAGILLLAAILPPTDILSLIFLTLPPLLLFELTLVLSQIMTKSHIYT